MCTSIKNYVALFLLAVCTIGSTRLSAQEDEGSKFQSAMEAYRVGVAYYNSRNYKSAKEPFEVALKMTKDEKLILKIQRALVQCYGNAGEVDPLIESASYVINNTKAASTRSLTRRSLVYHLYKQKKIDDSIKRFEEAVKKNEKDTAAIYVLIEIYVRLRRDHDRAGELAELLAKNELKDGKPVNADFGAQVAQQFTAAKKHVKGAELYEQVAAMDAKLAAWHWKEAANAWLAAKENEKALAAAKKSSSCAPEKRSKLLSFYWHESLASAFMKLNEPKLAVPHFEKAIEFANTKDRVAKLNERLDEARKKAAQ